MAGVCIIAADGSNGIICVLCVGGREVDSVRGAAGLRHVQDLWSACSCGRTDRTCRVISYIKGIV